MSRTRDMEARITELEAELADLRHPLATRHRFEIAGRVEALEARLARHLEAFDRLSDAVERLAARDDGDGWKGEI